MSRSAWHVFIHPRTVARELEELEEEASAAAGLRVDMEELMKEYRESEEELEKLRHEKEELLKANQELETHVKDLSRRNTDLSGKLEAANASINDLNEELSYRKDAESRMADVDRLLLRFENMKNKYEERIRALRDMVKRLKEERNNDESYLREVEVIDMDAGTVTRKDGKTDPSFGLDKELKKREEARRNPPPRKKPPVDWLRTPID